MHHVTDIDLIPKEYLHSRFRPLVIDATDYLFPSIGCRFIALNNGIDTGTKDSSNDVMCFSAHL